MIRLEGTLTANRMVGWPPPKTGDIAVTTPMSSVTYAVSVA